MDEGQETFEWSSSEHSDRRTALPHARSFFLFLIPSFHLLLSHTLTLNCPSLSGAVNWYQLPRSARHIYPAAQLHCFISLLSFSIWLSPCLLFNLLSSSNGQSYTSWLIPVSQMRWGRSLRPSGQRRNCNKTHAPNPKPGEQVHRLSPLFPHTVWLSAELSSLFTANMWSAASSLKSEPLSDMWQPVNISANQLLTEDSLDISVKL